MWHTRPWWTVRRRRPGEVRHTDCARARSGLCQAVKRRPAPACPGGRADLGNGLLIRFTQVRILPGAPLAVPGSRDSASAHASAGSNPGKPSPTGDPTRPVPSRGTMLASRAPKSSSSPTTNRWIVPSSFFAMKSMSRSRKTPRPCSRSTSTRTRPSKSAPGPKLTAITPTDRNVRPDFTGLHGRSAVQPRPSPAAALLNLALTWRRGGIVGSIMGVVAQDLPDHRERIAAAYESKPAYGGYGAPAPTPERDDRVVTVLLECSETPGLGWNVTGMCDVAARSRGGPGCRNLDVEWAVLGAR